MEYKELYNRINALLNVKDVVTVAIDGMSGAGKSTLATVILKSYDCNVFHMDDFFLTQSLRTSERLAEIGGNIDYARFKNEIIDQISIGKDFCYRSYSCKTGRLSEPIKVFPKKLNIVEGVYSLHPFLRDAYDLKVFMSTDKTTQQKRILLRSGETLFKRFLNEWIPLENLYFAHYEIKKLCDLTYNS